MSMKPTCLVASYGHALNDPTSRRAAVSLIQAGWLVTVFQMPAAGVYASEPPAGVETYTCTWPVVPESTGPLFRVARWRRFRRELRQWIAANRPDLVITIMLHPLAALPNGHHGGKRPRLISCIYDIPSLQDAGWLDAVVFRRGWERLSDADVVWASDGYKAQLAQQFGGLVRTPLVCHNAPSLEYLPEPPVPRDGWLRAELRRQGAYLELSEGCVLLRAGAIGEHGGIEETLEAMCALPQNFVFVMMGRPTRQYKEKLKHLTSERGLAKRAFLWDCPSDEIWKLALQGADIGHLIHGPFPSGRMTRIYNLNSSLSNYRLFQYLAAGLPIISYDDPRMERFYQDVKAFRVVRVQSLVNDLARAWRELAAAPGLRKSLGMAGRRAHVLKYCWEKQFSEVLDAAIPGIR